MYLSKPKFDPARYYSVYDLRRVIDYYNEMYSKGRSNYLNFEPSADGKRARVYLTGKYSYKECLGIKRYQSNLYDVGDGRYTARDPRNMLPIKGLMAKLLSEEGEDNIRACFLWAENTPNLAQALSQDEPPENEPHNDWKYRYHYPEPREAEQRPN